MSIIIDFDTKKVINKAMKDLAKIPAEMPRVISRSINRAMDVGRTAISRDIRSRYAISHSDIKNVIDGVKKGTTRATSKSLNSRMVIDGRPLTIYHHFNVTPREPKYGGRKFKIRATIIKGRRMVVKKAFIMNLRGTPQVIIRQPKGKYPFKVVRTLGLPQMVSNKEVFKKIQVKMEDALAKRLDHEVDYALKKAGFRGGLT